jgi:uncharacterized protein (TIRG00374 family)
VSERREDLLDDERDAPGADETEDGRDLLRARVTRRGVITSVLAVAAVIAFIVFVLPHLADLRHTWDLVRDGDPWWLVAAALLEIASFWGHIALFRAVFHRHGSPIGWKASYEITMAGFAATRLFAAAGAGGIALTVWAVRRSGVSRRAVACRMFAFLVILYGVYMATLVVVGLGMYWDLLPGPSPFTLTAVPAALAAIAIAITLALALIPEDIERRLARWASGRGRLAQVARRLATGPPIAATGVRTALSLIRGRNVGVLGALAWWGFDIATLWACFHAFGEPPPWTVLIIAYFVGTLGNVLPLPAGIGGVEGGMIGCLLAFGVGGQLSVVAVLSYRAFAFFLPTLPGAIAYVQLRKTIASWGEQRGLGAAPEALDERFARPAAAADGRAAM